MTHRSSQQWLNVITIFAILFVTILVVWCWSIWFSDTAWAENRVEELGGSLSRRTITLVIPIINKSLRFRRGRPHTLVLNGRAVRDDQLIPILDALPDLVDVQLQDCLITDKSLEHLPSERVVFLYLGGTSLSDAGMSDLAKFRNLGNLDLTNVPITDAGFEELAKIKSLFDLNINRSKITDVGLREFAKHKQKCRIDVRGTAVTAETAEELQSRYPGMNIIYEDPVVSVIENPVLVRID